MIKKNNFVYEYIVDGLNF